MVFFVKELIAEGRSLRISQVQWQLKVKALFETSLTRIMIDLKGDALDTAAQYPNTARLNLSK